MMDEQNETNLFLAGFFILAAAVLFYTMVLVWQAAEPKAWPGTNWPINKIKSEHKGE